MSQVIIDVREKDEFEAEHVAESINIPLSMFAGMAPGVLNQLKDRKIIFMCRGGARASQAKAMSLNLGFNDAHTYEVYNGGLMQWKKDGHPTQTLNAKAPLSLMRQVQLVIGTLVVAFGLLGTFVDPWFALLAAAMGAGLLLAGATGFCALANVMGKLPWNRGDKGAARALCQLSNG